MILDKIENINLYSKMSDLFKEACDYISKTDFSKLEVGKYEIDGANLFFSVQEYNPKSIDNYSIEAHKNYADIQIIIRGHEKMGYSPLETLQIQTPYNEQKDIAFYKGDVNWFKVEQNMFAIFFPSDAHAPGIAIRQDDTVKKVVVKVKIV